MWRTEGKAEPADRSLALCEVLEQEYAAITGEAPEEAPPWEFTPAQILQPGRLAYRLTDGHDRASAGLRDGELQAVVDELRRLCAANDQDGLKRILSERLNALLPDSQLYDRAPGRFEGVRFRSQTLERLRDGPIAERNRLIFEDTFPELEKVYDVRLKRIHQKMREKELAALCLSGGGIRSATFALGVVQGLARNGLLGKFHYLSTVSGGGYLGAWLTAWIHHTSVQHVLDQLRKPSGRPLEPEPTPIWHLRTYSNYLSPRLGLLSADTWTLVATYLRNLFLTWLAFLPPLVGVLTVPLLLVAIVSWRAEGNGDSLQGFFENALALVAFIGGVLAVRYVHRNRPVAPGRTEGTELADEKRDQRSFLRWCLTPLVVAAVAATVWWAWAAARPGAFPVPLSLPVPVPVAFALIGVAVHLVGWVLAHYPKEGRGWGPLFGLLGEVLGIVGSGAAAGVIAWAIASLVERSLEQPALEPHIYGIYACLAVPMLLVLLLVFSHLYIGYTSGRQVDAAREWSARFSAWILIVVVAWLGGFGLVILGPEAIRWAFDSLRKQGEGVVTVAKTVVGALGVISGAVTLRTGHGAETPASAGAAGAPKNLALAFAAPTFVVFLIVLLGWVGSLLIGAAQSYATGMPNANPGSTAAIGAAAVVTALLIVFGILTALRVDTNKFSLHAMYRARLIRAYLGASRPAGERDPNRFTGFDDADNLRMRELRPPLPAQPSEPRQPFHVVNVALNLVGGSNLAWQERKAESFSFSPLHCGAPNQGYRPTRCAQQPGSTEEPKGYGGDRGVSLGTAITISGAAASPNMGYHSSTVISFLLTLFNVRLGWWLGNPGYAGRKVYRRSAPRSSLGLLLDEALGRTDDKNRYVYLSDGGHFENLGLYEMVLRRCHTIVVSDGGCDPSGAFEDLGNAIRKIRVDFGIPIELREVPIYPRRGNRPARAGKYCAMGTIRYSCVDAGAEDGTLIYLKPAFYGSEPADVYNYAKTSPTFPHETTADQFFSESQFESYRALGSHVIDQILPSPPAAADPFVQPSLARFARQISDYLSRPVGPATNAVVRAPAQR